MSQPIRPFVQMAINAVDVVLSDPEVRYDPDQFDRYETFESARDAALTSIEVMLDEGDYDDEDHRVDLERMRQMLESATTYDELHAQAAYRKFLPARFKKLSAA
jgi:hypothetical protein